MKSDVFTLALSTSIETEICIDVPPSYDKERIAISSGGAKRSGKMRLYTLSRNRWELLCDMLNDQADSLLWDADRSDPDDDRYSAGMKCRRAADKIRRRLDRSKGE